MEIIFNEQVDTRNKIVWSCVGETLNILIEDESQVDNLVKALGDLRKTIKISKLLAKKAEGPNTEDVLMKLKETFHYDPDTGLFTRLVDSGSAKKGDVIGNPENSDYVRIRVGVHGFMAHRLAWLYMTGDWPSGVIDHKDLNRSNNKWENLRDVSGYVNQRNMPLRKANTSGFSGVNWDKQNEKWHVTFRIDGKPVSLGRFKDKEEAVAVRLAAESEHWGPLDKIWDQL